MKTLLALKLLTWNIGQAYLGDLYESRVSDRHLPAIAAFVKAEAPDAFCAQEFKDKAQVERLRRLLPGYAAYPAEEDPRITDRGSALFLKEGAELSFIEMEGGRFPAAGIRGGEAVIACVHLSGFNGARRLRQVGALVDWARRASGALFVMGDMNFRPMSREHAEMSAAFQDASAGIGQTHAAGHQIDYIFARAPGRLSARARAVVGRRQGLMDHLPVAAEISLE